MDFYDTSSLIEIAEDIEKYSNILISSISLKELETIKTAQNKDLAVKRATQLVTRFFNDHLDKYQVIIFKTEMLSPIERFDLEINNDTKILACAISYSSKIEHFYSNDLSLLNLASLFFMDKVAKPPIIKDEYKGYKEIRMNDDEMAYFYNHLDENIYDLKINEYINVLNSNGESVDALYWGGPNKGMQFLTFKPFNSKWFGQVKPMSGDIYQRMAADSLQRNQITMVKGPAGSGKSYLALGYLLHLLDVNKIDKIVVFCNTVAVKGAARLGFYPGSREEKLLDSQIGNFLSSKLGSSMEVERMINDEQLILLPMADIRGYDTNGMNAGIYITEAQNLDIPLMKLALQRAGEDCIFIVDGDLETQVDDKAFEGHNNGMRRLSEIFRGSDIYGEVQLQKIHRSKIAEIAEQM